MEIVARLAVDLDRHIRIDDILAPVTFDLGQVLTADHLQPEPLGLAVKIILKKLIT